MHSRPSFIPQGIENFFNTFGKGKGIENLPQHAFVGTVMDILFKGSEHSWTPRQAPGV